MWPYRLLNRDLYPLESQYCPLVDKACPLKSDGISASLSSFSHKKLKSCDPFATCCYMILWTTRGIWLCQYCFLGLLWCTCVFQYDLLCLALYTASSWAPTNVWLCSSIPIPQPLCSTRPGLRSSERLPIRRNLSSIGALCLACATPSSYARPGSPAASNSNRHERIRFCSNKEPFSPTPDLCLLLGSTRFFQVYHICTCVWSGIVHQV